MKNSCCHTETQKDSKKNRGGRPKSNSAKPISWRPPSQEAKDKFLALGGGKWLNNILERMTDGK